MMMHVGIMSLFGSFEPPNLTELSNSMQHALFLAKHRRIFHAWIKSPSTSDNKRNLSLSHHIGARGCTFCNFKVHVFQDWLATWLGWTWQRKLLESWNLPVPLHDASNLASDSPPSAQINRMDWCFFEHAGLLAPIPTTERTQLAKLLCFPPHEVSHFGDVPKHSTVNQASMQIISCRSLCCPAKYCKMTLFHLKNIHDAHLALTSCVSAVVLPREKCLLFVWYDLTTFGKTHDFSKFSWHSCDFQSLQRVPACPALNADLTGQNWSRSNVSLNKK